MSTEKHIQKPTTTKEHYISLEEAANKLSDISKKLWNKNPDSSDVGEYAQQALNKYLELDQYDLVCMSNTFRGNIKHNIGAHYFILGKYDEARSYLTEAIQIYDNPKDKQKSKEMLSTLNDQKEQEEEFKKIQQSDDAPAYARQRSKGRTKIRKRRIPENTDISTAKQGQSDNSSGSSDDATPKKKKVKREYPQNLDHDIEFFDLDEKPQDNSNSDNNPVPVNDSTKSCDGGSVLLKANAVSFFGRSRPYSGEATTTTTTIKPEKSKTLSDEIKEISAEIVALQNKSFSNAYTPDDRFELSQCYSKISFLYAKANKKQLSEEYAENANLELEQARLGVLKQHGAQPPKSGF